MSAGGWEEIEAALVAHREASARYAMGIAGSGTGEVRAARDRVRAAIRTLPDRRERIAIAALQGLLARAGTGGASLDYGVAADAAAGYADALIEALDGKESA